MESLPTIPATQQSTEGERQNFMISYENAVIKEIMETHIPDGREIDAKSILQMVEDIFNSATPTTTEDTTKEVVSGDASRQAGVAASVFEQFTYIVNQLSSEISYKCMIGAEGHSTRHSTTVSLFRMLSSYSWDAKLVLTLAAFALIYGEFLLHCQVYSSSKLVRRMAILKQSHDLTESSVQLNTLIEAQNNLIKSILDLVKFIIAIKELPTGFLSPDNAAFSAAITIIPTASYWIIRSLVVCATNITHRSGTSHEYTLPTPEDTAREVSMLNHEIKIMNDYLRKQLDICYNDIEERKHHEAYEALLHSLENDYVDNMRSLKLLLFPKDDPQPLFDGYKRALVGIEAVKGKTVLLLITDIASMLENRLFRLEKFYEESRLKTRRVESRYYIIWIPVMNPSTQWTKETQEHIESAQSVMPWLFLHHPSLYHSRLIDQVLMRFVKENLQFKDKPILVTIDPLGKIVNSNALSMMYVWGNDGFPFSTAREKALWKETAWKEETWGLELLLGDIVDIKPIIIQKRHIFLYGGDSIDWAREFRLNASRVAQIAQIKVVMMYAGPYGKEYESEFGESNTKKHQLELWGSKYFYWESLDQIHKRLNYDEWNLFWIRLETMVNGISSTSKSGNNAAKQDQLLLQEVKKLVENKTRESVFAVYSKDGNIVINGSGTIMLSALREYENWKKDVEAKGFDVAFKEYYDKLYDAAHPDYDKLYDAAHPGYSVEFPATTDQHVKIPETMDCPKCNYMMQKYVNFSCSHGQSGNP